MRGIDEVAPLVAPLVLADIDGTLVHSHRRCADVQGATVVERYDGRAVGFMSPSAFAMLRDLQARSTLVPATARTTRQYSRIQFPAVPPVAIVAAGGLILVEGVPDPVWSAASQALVDATDATVDEVVHRMRSLPVAEEPRNGDDRFACVKVALEADISDFEEWCDQVGWRVVRQDGRIYALPRALSKATAVPRLTEIVGVEPTVALGDGLMDVEMMLLTDHRISPACGAMWKSGLRISTPVEGVGLSAAEEVLALALERVDTTRTARKA